MSRLEHANRAATQHPAKGIGADPELVKDKMGTVSVNRRWGSQHIIRVVCEHYKVTDAEIRSPSRRIHICRARHVAMYLMRKMTRLSYTAVSMCLNRTDHTTARHAFTSIERQMMHDQQVAVEVLLVERKVRGDE